LASFLCGYWILNQHFACTISLKIHCLKVKLRILMAIVYGVFFRLVALSFFIYIVYYTHQLFHGGEPFYFKNLALLLRFLTILTILLQVIYYALATPLQYFKKLQMHSALYTLSFTANLIVCIMFWALFIIDKNLLVDESELKLVPWWYIHACHTVGTPAIIFDGILWKPINVPMQNAILLSLIYFGGYIIYVEYLIHVQKLYPYPILAAFSDVGRLGFYLVTFVGTALCFGICVWMVRTLNQTHRKHFAQKTQRVEKKEAISVQNKQKKSRKVE
ncbi:FAR 17a AIG1 protein, partial [Schistosoma japonicum]